MTIFIHFNISDKHSVKENEFTGTKKLWKIIIIFVGIIIKNVKDLLIINMSFFFTSNCNMQSFNIQLDAIRMERNYKKN